MATNEYKIDEYRNPVLVSFGQSGRATVKYIKDDGINDTGEEMTKIIIVPYSEYISIYHPKKEDFIIDGEHLVLRIPTKFIIWENISPQTPRLKVLCGPNNEGTPHTKIHFSMLNELKQRQNMLLSLKKENAMLRMELDKARNPTNFKNELKDTVFSSVRDAILELNLKK